MPILLLRGDSSTSLSTLVETAQKKIYPLLEYDLRLNENHLDLTFVSKVDRKIPSLPTDEGFESDIDSLSLISSDNDSFTIEKLGADTLKTETDSANGSSSSDSDTEATENKSRITDSKIVADPSPPSPLARKHKESFNLVDCVCYTDVKSTDILIFVIKNETFVFKFDDITKLQEFYTNFSTLKALTNQKIYNSNYGTKFNLLQRTDQNGITHIEIARETALKLLKNKSDGPSIIAIQKHEERASKIKSKDVNSRQRTDSKIVTDLISKPASRIAPLSKSSSIDNIMDLENISRLVSSEASSIRRVWNSAEDLLDPPKRPERRKKGRAPQPPVKPQDVFSGQYIRVNVNLDGSKDFDKNRLVIKSSLNEPHPKKLQSFNVFGTKNGLSSFLRRDKQILKYEPKLNDITTLSRSSASLGYSNWTNSVPRLLKRPKAKPDARNPTPMAYRYIDTIQDFTLPSSKDQSSSFLKKHPPIFGQNAAFSNYLRRETNDQHFNSRLFGLSAKLKDFQHSENSKDNWKTFSEISGISQKDNNLKSVIKINKDDNGRKKNDKKVTFSAYTTVQVV